MGAKKYKYKYLWTGANISRISIAISSVDRRLPSPISRLPSSIFHLEFDLDSDLDLDLDRDPDIDLRCRPMKLLLSMLRAIKRTGKKPKNAPRLPFDTIEDKLSNLMLAMSICLFK